MSIFPPRSNRNIRRADGHVRSMSAPRSADVHVRSMIAASLELAGLKTRAPAPRSADVHVRSMIAASLGLAGLKTRAPMQTTRAAMLMVLWILIFLLSSTPTQAAAVQPDEMDALRHWVTLRFTGTAPDLPFSFLYDGQPSTGLLPAWNQKQETRTLDTQRQEHTLLYSDSKSGIQIRCVAIEYRDFPAVEWMVYIHNGGGTNTAIFEKIEPLDLQFTNSPGGRFILHHALGDGNTPTNSFTPVDQTLTPENSSPLYLAPNGGRSSDGHLPFFNLEWQAGGLVLAIGWSGQWAASFQSIGDHRLQVQAGMQKTPMKSSSRTTT